MDIPKFHEFMRPLLEVLHVQGELSRNDAQDLWPRSTDACPRQPSRSALVRASLDILVNRDGGVWQQLVTGYGGELKK